jgi:hypothetical protein
MKERDEYEGTMEVIQKRRLKDVIEDVFAF